MDMEGENGGLRRVQARGANAPQNTCFSVDLQASTVAGWLVDRSLPRKFMLSFSCAPFSEFYDRTWEMRKAGQAQRAFPAPAFFS